MLQSHSKQSGATWLSLQNGSLILHLDPHLVGPNSKWFYTHPFQHLMKEALCLQKLRLCTSALVSLQGANLPYFLFYVNVPHRGQQGNGRTPVFKVTHAEVLFSSGLQCMWSMGLHTRTKLLVQPLLQDRGPCSPRRQGEPGSLCAMYICSCFLS